MVDEKQVQTGPVAQRTGRRTLYDVLQVSPRADWPVLQGAYRSLARVYHPDLGSDEAATERMCELNEAFAVLSDSRRRALYDLTLKRQQFAESPRTGILEGLRAWRRDGGRYTSCWRCSEPIEPFAPYCRNGNAERHTRAAACS